MLLGNIVIWWESERSVTQFPCSWSISRKDFKTVQLDNLAKNGEKGERSISQSISHSQARDTAKIDGRETRDHALETDELMKASHCFLSDYSFLCYHGNRGVVQIDSSRGLFTHRAANCGVFFLSFSSFFLVCWWWTYGYYGVSGWQKGVKKIAISICLLLKQQLLTSKISSKICFII